MHNSVFFEGVKARLGGEKRLAAIGARDFTVDGTHVSFRLVRPNPAGVKLVDISVQPNGRLTIDCFGALIPGTFRIPLVKEENDIFPENLARVLDQIVGDNDQRHRHNS
jgi:hypothetical protein